MFLPGKIPSPDKIPFLKMTFYGPIFTNFMLKFFIPICAFFTFASDLLMNLPFAKRGPGSESQKTTAPYCTVHWLQADLRDALGGS